MKKLTFLQHSIISLIVLLSLLLVASKDASAASYQDALAKTKHYFKNGNIQAAFSYCNEAIELDPKSTEAILIRGWLLLHANKADRAIIEFNKVIALDPNNVNGYKSRGLVYRQTKEFELSQADLDKALTLDPNDVEANYLHGISYMLDGNHNRALEDFDKAIANGKNHPRLNHLYYWRGRTKQFLSDHQGAVDDLTKSMQLSKVHIQSNVKPDPKYDLSTLFFKVALSTEQSDTSFGQLERGISYMSLGQYMKAAADLTDTIASQPKDAIMFEERGVAYLLAGQYQKALKDFNQALLLGSHSTDLYLRMAITNFCMGKYDRVPSVLETWFKREGYSADLSPLAINIAYTSYIRTKQFKKAHNFLTLVGQSIPAKEKWHLTAYKALKRSLCCKSILENAGSPSDKHFAEAHLLSANFYSLTKKYSKAKEEYKKVLRTTDKRALELAIARMELKQFK